MGIKGIDHDTLANRRDWWIGGSRVVSIPSNAEVDAVWFVFFRATRQDGGLYDTDAGSIPRRAKPIRERGASGVEEVVVG
jgi:hypothetical protein